MKKIKMFLASVTSALSVLSFPSCSIGGGVLTFETNGGSYIHQVALNAGQEHNLLSPTRTGYQFVAWYYDAQLTNRVSTPFTMGTKDMTIYAKYTIDETQFSETGTVLNWSGGSVYTEQKDFVQNYHSKLYLLKNGVSMYALNTVSVLPASDSALVAEYVKVFADNGLELADSNPAPNVWQSASPLSMETRFIIEIKITSSGQGYLQIESANG